MHDLRISLIVVLIVAFFPMLLACAENDFSTGSGQGDNDDVGSLGSYSVVDTGQVSCYDGITQISCPSTGQTYHGQDAQYDGNQPSYRDNGDGTVTDLRTGLMWQQNPGEKMSYDEAAAGADSFSLAGHKDWRLPTIKELYSLIMFDGEDPSGEQGSDTSGMTPFIEANYFDFQYGDAGAGERIIDSQWATSSIYEASVMGGQECFFGVNFADGRIKCYPMTTKGYFTIYVRGAAEYGKNAFQDNGDSTINDLATGLLWQQADSGEGFNWEEALNYCESLELAGRDDWRLPNAKELQSLVDYSWSPDTTDSAAIDPSFDVTMITNEAGQVDYPFYWTGTTHASSNGSGGSAAYVAFGRALGYMSGQWMDVHGAGAQRSDPKTGDPASFPQGRGPQGDAIRIYNFARCVTVGEVNDDLDGDDDAVDDEVDDDAVDDDLDDDMAEDDYPPEPPYEAIDACDGKSEGDACEFESPHGTLTGICRIIGDILACVPEF